MKVPDHRRQWARAAKTTERVCIRLSTEDRIADFHYNKEVRKLPRLS